MITDPSAAKATLYLSDRRTMYIGQLAPLLCQNSAASTLIFSLDNTLEVIDPVAKQQYQSRSFLIPAGSQSIINTKDSLLTLCFLDPLGKDLIVLKNKMSNEIPISNNAPFYSCHNQEDLLIQSARILYECTSPPEFAFSQLSRWIGEPEEGTALTIDPRVKRAVEMIKSSVLENRSVESIAQELNLSVSRLSQLFKQATGVPVRRFRIWHRIYITAVKMAYGLSLTEACVSSGFSDSSHFSRVFKEIGGIKPSKVLNSKNDTLIMMLPTENNPTRIKRDEQSLSLI